MFVDDAYRTPDELAYCDDSELVRRRLTDGRGFTIVKAAHSPQGLERRVARLGWEVSVTATSGPF
jgi:hypothetical protein